VRLGPLGTSATKWPIVPAPDDGWWEWSSRWNESSQGKPKYSEKTCPSATLSTTNPTWPELISNPGRRGGKPATNRLSYGAASTRCSNFRYLPRKFILNKTPVSRKLLHADIPVTAVKIHLLSFHAFNMARNYFKTGSIVLTDDVCFSMTRSQ
jgi:hypothetical protein